MLYICQRIGTINNGRQRMNNTAEKYETKKRNVKRKMLIRLIVSAVTVILLAVGVSRAWFMNENNIATLMEVKEPSPIAIRGPHGETLSSLDMSYTDEDKEGSTVTIKRVVSISSDEEKHRLEIVHTTNLKGLTFKIYPATEVPTSDTNNENSITEGKYTYQYDKNNPLKGEYINQDSEKITADYKYANNSKHTTNFNQYANVQIHAEPIYWLANEEQQGNRKNDENVSNQYLNYYVIEISWTETEKETDIFYLLVKNA